MVKIRSGFIAVTIIFCTWPLSDFNLRPSWSEYVIFACHLLLCTWIWLWYFKLFSRYGVPDSQFFHIWFRCDGACTKLKCYGLVTLIDGLIFKIQWQQQVEYYDRLHTFTNFAFVSVHIAVDGVYILFSRVMLNDVTLHEKSSSRS